MLAGEQTLQDIMLNDLDWYARTRHHAAPRQEIVEIDRNARKVIAADGTRRAYDRLLLATGSNPFILPVPGKELDGVLDLSRHRRHRTR